MQILDFFSLKIAIWSEVLVENTEIVAVLMFLLNMREHFKGSTC